MDWYREHGLQASVADDQVREVYFSKLNSLKAPAFYAGIVDVIKELNLRGYVLAIVSTGRGDHIRRCLDRELCDGGQPLSAIFDRIIDHAVDKCKPLHELAHEFECEINEVVLVGDLESDVADGLRAGAQTIGVINTPEMEEVFRRAGAHYRIRNRQKILDIVLRSQ